MLYGGWRWELGMSWGELAGCETGQLRMGAENLDRGDWEAGGLGVWGLGLRMRN